MKYQVRYLQTTTVGTIRNVAEDFTSKKKALTYIEYLKTCEDVKQIGFFQVYSKRIKFSRKRFQASNGRNQANTLDIKGHRCYVKGTTSQVKKLIGHLVKKIRPANTQGYVEIIHTSNRGSTKFERILADNDYKLEFGKR